MAVGGGAGGQEPLTGQIIPNHSHGDAVVAPSQIQNQELIAKLRKLKNF